MGVGALFFMLKTGSDAAYKFAYRKYLGLPPIEVPSPQKEYASPILETMEKILDFIEVYVE